MRRFQAWRMMPLLLALLLARMLLTAQPVVPPDSLEGQVQQARALREQGALGEARKRLEALLPKLEQAGLLSLQAAARNQLSLIDAAEGRYQAAAQHATQAVELYRRIKDRQGEAQALNNVGVAELYAGNYAPAGEHMQQSLALYQSIGNREGVAEQWSNLGNVRFFQGSYLDALRAYQQSSQNAGSDIRRQQLARINLATLYQRIGRYNDALILYHEQAGSAQALRPSEQARQLTNEGALYRRLGDPVKALETYRAAQALFAREHHQDGEMGVLKNIGIVLALDLGQLAQAGQVFRQVLEQAEQTHNTRQALQAHLYLGEIAYQQEQTAAAEEQFRQAYTSAQALHATEEEWKALYGLGRVAARIGDARTAVANFRQAIAKIESTRSRLQLTSLKTDFLADKRDVYDALTALLLPGKNAAEILTVLEQSRSRVLQEQRSEQGSMAPVTLARLQSTLDDATLLLEYWVTPARLAVVWATRTTAGIAETPLAASDKRALTALVTTAAQSDDQWRTAAQEPGRLLLSGIPPLQSGQIRHLVIVPDGIIQTTPFDLLPVPGRTAVPLIEQFDISLLPTALLLMKQSPHHGWRWPWQQQLLAFADPVLPVTNDPLTGDPLPERLTGAAQEAETIAQLSRGRADLMLGSADQKQTFLARSQEAPLLHLATHAQADEENPESSRILFSPSGPKQMPDYLFLREIYGLDLRGADLVTLSACDTERGQQVPGEGAQSFSRALLAAGSQAAVTSLWRVADQPTAQFMKQFYYELYQGRPKAMALQQAKLSLRRSHTSLSHPRHWAAFVLTGDGRVPVTPVVSWEALLFSAAILLASGALLLRWRLRRRAERRHRLNDARVLIAR